MIPVALLGVGGSAVMQIAEDGSALQIIASIAFLASCVLTVIAYYKRCKAFGHGVGYTIGHIIAPGVLTIVLGFGKSQYIGNTTTGVQNETNTTENENE